MTDLKLIDELLIDLLQAKHYRTVAELENHSSVTRDAMERLREASASGEMPVITLRLARYFEGVYP